MCVVVPRRGTSRSRRCVRPPGLAGHCARRPAAGGARLERGAGGACARPRCGGARPGCNAAARRAQVGGRLLKYSAQAARVSGWIAGKLQGAIGKNLTFPSCADIPLPPLLAADAPAAGMALPAFLAALQDGAVQRPGCQNVASPGFMHRCKRQICMAAQDCGCLPEPTWCSGIWRSGAPTGLPGCQCVRRNWAARASILARGGAP
jgi:hypothetical protein